MAIGRAYRIKKNAVKAYGYTKPPAKRRRSRLTPNASVTHIAAINGPGAYSAHRRSARSAMSGVRPNARRTVARSSLTAAQKTAFANRMRRAKGKGSASSRLARNPRVRRVMPSPRANARRVARIARPKSKSRRRVRPARRGTAKKSATARRKKTPMARKIRRRKKSAARKPVARRRVKRRKSAKRSASAAPKRRRRRKAKKTTLKANRRRRHRRNSGTSAGARKGWRTRRAGKKAAPRKRRRSRKASAVAPKRRRRRSRKASAVAPKRRRRVKRRRSRKASAVAPKRRRRRSKRKMTTNRRHRRNRRRRAATPNRRRRSHRRSMSPNRRRRSRRHTSNRRRRSHRRNGRRMFRKNGIMEPVMFIAKTGGLALAGLVAHKLITNAFVKYGMNAIFGAPAAVVAVTPAASSALVSTPATAVVTPATSGLGGLSLDPSYQTLIGSFLVAGGGIFATAKLIKDPGTRNSVMTGFALSFMYTGFQALLAKFAPQYSGMLAGDGTAARLSAMYGLGSGTSIMPRYAAISGRGGMGEYFQSTNGLGEYFQSGVNGLGEYFDSGVSGLGLPAYEAAAGYGANPDLMEAAAGMGARTTTNTNHVDPHGDLDRELTIAEAAAGVGAVQSYEASAGYGDVSTVPSSSTWIPGSSNPQIWAGTRSISSPQSSSEMVPAGILQTDGGQGVFG